MCTRFAKLSRFMVGCMFHLLQHVEACDTLISAGECVASGCVRIMRGTSPPFQALAARRSGPVHFYVSRFRHSSFLTVAACTNDDPISANSSFLAAAACTNDDPISGHRSKAAGCFSERLPIAASVKTGSDRERTSKADTIFNLTLDLT